jgi:hypothetical protein
MYTTVQSPIPTCVERLSALQGAAEILEQTCKSLHGSPPYASLRLLASMIRRETAAIGEVLVAHDLYESPCPSVSERLSAEDDELPLQMAN